MQVAAVNDAPVTHADTLTATEDTPITYSAAQLLGNDTDVDGNSLRITSVNSGSGGTAVLNADGSVTFTPNANFNGNANFSYVVSDGTVLSAPASVTVQVAAVNDAPTISTPAAVTLSEEGLSSGLADTSGLSDQTNQSSFSGSVTVSDVDNSNLSVSWIAPSTAYTSHGQALVWALSSDGHTLVGTAGNGGTEVIRATIGNNGQYNVTLSGSLDHPQNNLEDTLSLNFGLRVSDGTNVTTTELNVTVEDDAPSAVQTTVQGAYPVNHNIMLLLDVSGSMAEASGIPGKTKLQMMQESAYNLLDQYSTMGTTVVRIVTFSGSATAQGATWVGINEAKSLISNLRVGGYTNYDGALLTAQNAFNSAGKLDAAKNISYFLTDGDPTASSDWDGYGGLSNTVGIQTGEEALWKTFLTTNQITSFAYEIDTQVTPGNLNPIAYDGAAARDLNSDTMYGTKDLADAAPSTAVTGSLLTQGGFGGDGGYVKSVTVDGVTYTYNASTNSISGTNNSTLAGNQLVLHTAQGETISVNMLTGEYAQARTNLATTGIAAIADTAPSVTAGSTTLGGLNGLSALNLMGGAADINAFSVNDANNNLKEVTVGFSGSLSFNLGAKPLTYSAALATELGITVTVTDTFGSSGGTYSLKLTATDGSTLDNLQINEFLSSVRPSSTLLAQNQTNGFSIIATDTTNKTTSATGNSLFDLDLLTGSAQQEGLIQGTAAGDSLDLSNATRGERIYGMDGNDTLTGSGYGDLIRGGSGNDLLLGGLGDDVLAGGKGNDTLTGGSGHDVFRWENGSQGTVGAPAIDTVTDFNTAPLANGGDAIDLSNMLQGEAAVAGKSLNLTSYLHFEKVGSDTVLHISSRGGYANAYTTAQTDQKIVFKNVDLMGNASTDLQAINNLLASGKLIVDSAIIGKAYTVGDYTDLQFVLADSDGDTASGLIRFNSNGQPIVSSTSNNVAADIATNDNLLNVDGLNLIQLGARQVFSATDRNNNLSRIDIHYQAVLGLAALTLAASQTLAAELGLKVTVSNDPGLSSLVDPSSHLTITALDGGTLDNQAVNELLGTVTYQQNGAFSSAVSGAVLNATTFTATDSAGLQTSKVVGALVDLNDINQTAAARGIFEDSDSANALTGTSGEDRLYGHGGNDTLHGAAGNDLLAGGSGNDSLYGDEGNDLLIGGSGDDQLFGGEGDDVFQWREGDVGTAGSPAMDVVNDFNPDHDHLDLSEVLIGEENHLNDLSGYLHVDVATSTLQVSSTGSLDANGGHADLTIQLKNNGAPIDLSAYGSTSSDIIRSLVSGSDPLLRIDHN